MQALLRCHHGGAERGSPTVWMEEKAPEHIHDWLSQEMPSDWIPTFAGEHLFSKIKFSIRKGSECFGSSGSLEGFPMAFQAAGCDVAFCCVSRLTKLISLVCCEEGRRCTQRSRLSSAKDTTGMDRVWYTGNGYICLG